MSDGIKFFVGGFQSARLVNVATGEKVEWVNPSIKAFTFERLPELPEFSFTFRPEDFNLSFTITCISYIHSPKIRHNIKRRMERQHRRAQRGY